MKRNAIKNLIAWKEAGGQLPALLYGCKGCGKTWLALDFAKSFFEGCFYVNFENNTLKREQLENGCSRVTNRTELILLLAECFEVPVELFSAFLIIFDEISCSKPVQETILNYLPHSEKAPCYVLLVSSHPAELLDTFSGTDNNKATESAAGQSKQQPKRLQPIHLAPLQFDEFLMAIGSEWYAEVIQGHYQTSHRIPTIVHTELLDLFEDYLVIGGMPAAINEYLQTESLENIPEIHRNLLGSMQYHIQNVYEEGLALRMQQVLEVLPAQLLKENQKFQYKLLRKGATFQLYREAIEQLKADFMISGCLKLFEESSFKLFPLDVGMYHSMLQYPGAEEKIFALIKPSKFYERQLLLRKDILDCYFMQAMTAKGHHPFFWESASQAKIDFILKTEEGNIPVEIKTTENSRSRSIGVYRNEYKVPYSIKLSANNFEISEQQKNLPYYSLFCL